MALLAKITSGGQTGADRAALDFAIRRGIPSGGWCPAGRKAEDGPIPTCYQLRETPRSDYLQRTEWNARDTDATVIFTLRPELSGGSKRTADFAAKHGKPWLHISAASGEESANTLRGFLERHNVGHLNVAGSRASKEPEVYDLVMQTLAKALFPNEAA